MVVKAVTITFMASKKPRHPAAGCTSTQREIFEALCIGRSVPIPPQTRDALLRRGLIEQTGTRPFGTGWSGVTVPVWGVPLAVRMAWCEWRSAHEQRDA